MTRGWLGVPRSEWFEREVVGINIIHEGLPTSLCQKGGNGCEDL